MTDRTPRTTWLTPLSREDLFDPGTVFARDELTRRVLTFFWRDCCCPACFSRAPAPVIELAPGADERPERLRAWWLLEDGIVGDCEGPYSDRLRAFFGDASGAGEHWPRYAFRITPEPLEVKMTFFREPGAAQAQRTRFAPAGVGLIGVIGQELSWNL